MRIAFGIASSLVFLLGLASTSASQTKPDIAYGKPEDVTFAKQLWTVLQSANLVGGRRTTAPAAKGHQPHGNVYQLSATVQSVAGQSGRTIVKSNHRGKHLKPADVDAAPNTHLTGYAVMFQRDTIYDPKNENWFWVVYDPDGTLRRFEKTAIAGRVDTGDTNGCIGCHRKYGGKDLETLTPQ